MRRLYGDAIRKESGFSKTVRKVAADNVVKAPKEFQRKVKDISDALEKAIGETTGAVETLLGKCRLLFLA